MKSLYKQAFSVCDWVSALQQWTWTSKASPSNWLQCLRASASRLIYTGRGGEDPGTQVVNRHQVATHSPTPPNTGWRDCTVPWTSVSQKRVDVTPTVEGREKRYIVLKGKTDTHTWQWMHTHALSPWDTSFKRTTWKTPTQSSTLHVSLRIQPPTQTHVRAHTLSVVCALDAVIASPCYHRCCTALRTHYVHRISLKKKQKGCCTFLYPSPPLKTHTQRLKYTWTEATTTPRHLIYI